MDKQQARSGLIPPVSDCYENLMKHVNRIRGLAVRRKLMNLLDKVVPTEHRPIAPIMTLHLERLVFAVYTLGATAMSFKGTSNLEP